MPLEYDPVRYYFPQRPGAPRGAPEMPGALEIAVSDVKNGAKLIGENTESFVVKPKHAIEQTSLQQRRPELVDGRATRFAVPE